MEHQVFGLSRNICRTLILLLVLGCGQSEKPPIIKSIANIVSAPPSKTATAFGLQDFYAASPALDCAVDLVYQQLSVKEKAAQLIMDAGSEAASAGLPFSRVRQLVLDKVAGNVIFLKGSRSGFQQEIDILDSLTDFRLTSLYACDCEPALFNQKMTGTPPVKLTRDLANEKETEEASVSISNVLIQTGINVNFAPVSDLGINRKAINRRSFGTDPNDIIAKSVAFVQKTQDLGIAACVKHFPGHGAIEGDTHKGRVSINGELTELATFKTVISRSRPVFVMVGHMGVINNAAYNTNGLPCSISPKVITGLLKEDLGFKGIVITDAMNMKALDNVADVDWKAVEAGADLILMPRSPGQLHARLVTTLQREDPLRGRVEASIKKIIRLKICLNKIAGSRSDLSL